MKIFLYWIFLNILLREKTVKSRKNVKIYGGSKAKTEDLPVNY